MNATSICFIISESELRNFSKFTVTKQGMLNLDDTYTPTRIQTVKIMPHLEWGMAQDHSHQVILLIQIYIIIIIILGPQSSGC